MRRAVVAVAGPVLLCAVLLAGVLAGCGGSSKPTAADAEFLSSVHTAAPDVGTYRSDTALIRLGHAACDGLATGAPAGTVADRLALQEGSKNQLPTDELGTVISSAVQAYCPKEAGALR